MRRCSATITGLMKMLSLLPWLDWLAVLFFLPARGVYA